MRLAQELYEGLELGEEGRSASSRTCAPTPRAFHRWRSSRREATSPTPSARTYLPESARQYRVGKAAQDAHEAIRPTDVGRIPDAIRGDLTADQFKIYQTIWLRFLASQMAAAVYDQTTVDFFPTERHQFRARGSVLKFPGFVRVYDEAAGETPLSAEETDLPRLEQGRRRACSGPHLQPAFYAAAPALLRGHAGQGARGRRHRTTLHVRQHHFDPPGPRLRATRSAPD